MIIIISSTLRNRFKCHENIYCKHVYIRKREVFSYDLKRFKNSSRKVWKNKMKNIFKNIHTINKNYQNWKISTNEIKEHKKTLNMNQILKFQKTIHNSDKMQNENEKEWKLKQLNRFKKNKNKKNYFMNWTFIFFELALSNLLIKLLITIKKSLFHYHNSA